MYAYTSWLNDPAETDVALRRVRAITKVKDIIHISMIVFFFDDPVLAFPTEPCAPIVCM